MSVTRHILTSGAQLTLANALARVLGIISLPLLTRWLAPAAYGQAALASTLISLVSVIFLMGMDMSYARSYLSRTPPNGESVEIFCWRSAWLAAVISGCVAAVVWMIHVQTIPVAMPALAWFVMAGAVGSLLLSMAQTRSRLHNRHLRLAIAVAAGGISATAITLVLAKWVLPDERALVAGYMTAYFVPIAIMGMPGWKQLRLPSGLDASARKAVFLVGAPGVITAPMYWILSSSDRWFLQASVDAPTVGVYAVACTFGQLGMMVNSALLAIWLPEATRMHEAADLAESKRVLGALIARLLAVMMLVWLGVGILGGDLMRFLSNDRFHRGAIVVPWIATAVFFYGCYHLANTGLFLSRRLKLSAFVWALVGFLSLFANGMLVPRFGMMAAAYVQCGTFMLLAMTVLVLAQRSHFLPLPYQRIGLALAVVAAGLMIGSGLPDIKDWATAACKLLLVAIASIALLAILVPEVWGHLRNTLRRDRVVAE